MSATARRYTLGALVPALVAGAVVAAAATSGDWWVEGYDGFDTNLWAARVLLFCGVFAAVALGIPALRRVKRVGWLVFAGWCGYLGLWLLGTWPGLIMSDTADVVINAKQGIVYEWFSYLHPLLNIALLDVVPHVAVWGPLQVALTAAVFAYATTTLLSIRPSRGAAIAMNVLAAVSVPVIANTLLYSRDTLFGLLHVFLALWVARIVTRRSELTPLRFAGLALLVGFLTVYRGDGIILALVVPAVLWFGLRPSRDVALRAGGVLVGVLLAFHVALPAVLAVQKQPHRYELALRLNPLGQVLQSNFYSETKEQDLATLGRVIDVEAARQKSTPAEIPVYWEGNWKGDATEEEWDAFFAVSDRLIRDNLFTVIGGRVATFSIASGLGREGFRGPEQLVEREADRFTWIAQKEGLEGEAPVLRLYDVESDLLRGAGEFDGLTLSGSALHWNLIPSLLLLAGTLLFWRRLPLEAAFALIVLSRVPLVFAAAPAAQFKYYYSVHLGGIILFGLLLAHLRAEHVRGLAGALRVRRPVTS